MKHTKDRGRYDRAIALSIDVIVPQRG